MLVAGAHIEYAVADAEVNKTYCKKDGDWEEYGATVVQGQRTDLAAAAVLCRDHGLKRVAEEMPTVFIKFHKGLLAYRQITATPRDRNDPAEVEVHWGEAGAGKTRHVADLCDGKTTWWHAYGKWCDGYDQEECVVFDDMPSDIPFRMLLKLLDRYPIPGQVKGSFVVWKPKVIYLTSNLEPINWYRDIAYEEWLALKRRLLKVRHWKLPNGSGS